MSSDVGDGTLEVVPDGTLEVTPDGDSGTCQGFSQPDGSGCEDDAVCLTYGSVCYPRVGTSPERCGDAERFVIDLGGLDRNEGQTITRRYSGVVRTHADGELTIETQGSAPGESIAVSYAIGPHVLPVAVGDEVVMDLRWVAGWLTTRGLALWTNDGRLLALVDEGNFGSAWLSRSNTLEERGGFDVATEPMGCAVRDDNFCAFSIPLGQRFTHGQATVLVPPGQTAELTTADGTYQVINAWAEAFAELQCTDTAPTNAWAILAADRR